VPEPPNAEVVATWIWPENLRPFAEALSRWTDYRFDDADWIGLSNGLDGTDSDAGRWFSCPIGGHPPFEIRAAKNVGDDPISVRVLAVDDITDDLRVRILTAAELFNVYRIR
jgi:hypothetical protein